MTAIRGLKGKRFGRLIVLDRGGVAPNGEILWSCQCQCGRITKVMSWSLVSGNTRSCGCLKIEKFLGRITKHGHSTRSRTAPAYTSWCKMLTRCNNPNDTHYDRYGGRGIKVCKRWTEKFENFLNDMGERPIGSTLERINNDGDYEPGNCRWVTRKDQMRNRCNTPFVTYEGKRIAVVALAERLGISRYKLYHRIVRRGWPVERAIAVP